MFRLATGILLVSVTCGGAAAALAGAADELASHRAVYDLTLDPSVDSGDIGDVSGRVVTEFSGSSCAGYKATMRFVMAIENEDGDKQITDTRTVSFEDSAGTALDFSNQTYVDDKLTADSSGKAKRTGKGVTVSLVKPAVKKVDFSPSVIFPTQQIEQILAAARDGRSFVDASIYDGTDDGQKAFATAAVIGREIKDGDDGDAAVNSALAGMRHWPVTVSYFDSPDPGEETPAQIMSFVLYENGVQTNLKINYGTFSVTLRMTKLDMLPAAPCKKP